MKGNTTSCRVPARTAARMLLPVSQANRIADKVFRPKSGVKPKKMPMAMPPAIACGVSLIASSFNECVRNQLRKFMRCLKEPGEVSSEADHESVQPNPEPAERALRFPYLGNRGKGEFLNSVHEQPLDACVIRSCVS